MAEHIAKTLSDVKEAIAKLEREVAQKKELANQIAEMGDLELPYPSITTVETADISGVIARDAFVGEPLHTAIRRYLESRRQAMPKSAPATVNEILEGVRGGGYTFEAKNEENMKRSIRITLTKNSTTFHRIDGDTEDMFGLVVWYGPKIQKRSKRANVSDQNGQEDDALDAVDDTSEVDEEAEDEEV